MKLLLPGELSKANLIKRYFGKASVLFVCCTHRQFDVDATTAVMNLYAQKKHDFIWCPMKGDALIDRSRSRVASFFMRERTEDIIFFVDDDEDFKTQDVIKVVDNVVAGMDICGGMVMLKKPVTMINNHIQKNVLFFPDQEVTFSHDSKPVEIRYLGSGFMAIHRRVFKSMIDRAGEFPVESNYNVPFCHPSDLKFWPWFQPFWAKNDLGEQIYLSEDWAFCNRARKFGHKVWLDPSVFIDHKGEYRWNLADALRPPKVKMDENFKVTLA